jgi:hypothetical protein
MEKAEFDRWNAETKAYVMNVHWRANGIANLTASVVDGPGPFALTIGGLSEDQVADIALAAQNILSGKFRR